MSIKELLVVTYDHSAMSFEEIRTFQSRGRCVSRLFQDAYDGLPETVRAQLKPTRLSCYVGDHSPHPFSFSAAQPRTETLPCHVFDAWPEVGIPAYDAVCDELSQRGLTPPVHDALFWIGNAATHGSRRALLEQSAGHPHMHILDSGAWVDGRTTQQHVSLADHCQYRFLLDVRGIGYSGRTKILLASRRPVFYQDRTCHEYWFWDLQPFVHYIPVAADFSDLADKLDWARRHPEACAQIAEQALAFHQQHLRRAHAVARCAQMLLRWGIPRASTGSPSAFSPLQHRLWRKLKIGA